MSWFQDVFGHEKAIIGMIHLPALPGTPRYDERGGMAAIVARVEADLENLQSGGIDAVMFCNEDDRPYQLQVGPEAAAAMTRAVSAVLPKIRVPFGIDLLWDPLAAIAVAHATDAAFVREVFTGVYGGEIGLWNTNCAEALRFRRRIGADRVKLLYNINAEFAAPLAPRDLATVARSAVFSSLADAICVSGPMTGSETGTESLRAAREAVPGVPIFANTGVTAETVKVKLAVADGAVVGTSLKRDGVTWNPVDPARVSRLMAEVRQFRGEI
jgi:uncharacterized protein